jgi:putative FmdB family regulatory protein
MPTYEYECDACHHNFDEFQSMSEPALTKCPKCGKKKLRRLFGTGSAILFKGSGFYQTDYRSESYKQAAKADQDAAGKSAGKADGNGTSGSTGTTGTGDTASSGGSKKAKGKTSKSEK